MTSDKNIKKLINKFNKPKKCNEKKKKTPIEEEKELEKFEFYRDIPFKPPKPPKIIGYLEKMGNLIFNFRSRFIEIDPIFGSLRRYKYIEDYPNNPK